MKKLKDFLYDKNDILIALIILIVAGLLIVWRIDSIMKYPDTLIAETSTERTTEESAIDEKDKADDEAKEEDEDKDKEESTEDDSTEDDGSEDIPTSPYSNGTLDTDLTVSVASGSVTAAVDSLIAVGLFDSYDDFENACASAGVSSDSIKASTFTFAAGSTKADIAAKVTQ